MRRYPEGRTVPNTFNLNELMLAADVTALALGNGDWVLGSRVSEEGQVVAAVGGDRPKLAPGEVIRKSELA